MFDFAAWLAAHYFVTMPTSIIIKRPSIIIKRMITVIGFIMLIMLCDLRAWFKFVFLERASCWWSKSKPNKVKLTRDSDGCNHGLRLDLYKPNGGRGCVAFVQRWLFPYYRIYQYLMWKSSESIDWLVSYQLMTATNHFLNGSIDMAAIDAASAEFYLQLKNSDREMAKAKSNSSKRKKREYDKQANDRIHYADDPTLAAFLREHIPCKCLD